MAAGDGAIAFTDSCLSGGDLYRKLVHELVHLSDVGERISHTPQWAAFASPIMAELERRSHTLDIAKQKEWLKELGWPSYFACANLKEALACYTEAYLTDANFQASSKYRHDIGQLLILDCSPNERLWRQHYLSAKDSFKQGAFRAAADQYSQAIQLNALVPEEFAERARCRQGLHMNNLALADAQEAAKLLSASSKTAPGNSGLARQLAKIFVDCGDDAEALPLMNELLADWCWQQPADLLERARCHERLRHYAQAADDFVDFNARRTLGGCQIHFGAVSAGAREAALRHDYEVLSGLDKLVTLHKRNPDYYHERGNLLLRMSDDGPKSWSFPLWHILVGAQTQQAGHDARAVTLRKQALKDFATALSLPTEHRRELLSLSATAELAGHNYDSCIHLCSQALRRSPSKLKTLKEASFPGQLEAGETIWQYLEILQIRLQAYVALKQFADAEKDLAQIKACVLPESS